MRIKSFIVVAVIASLSLVLYGILVLISPEGMMPPIVSYAFMLPPGSDQMVNYLAALFRLLGYFNILLGTAAFILLLRWIKEPQAWLLRVMFIFTTLAYLGPLVFDYAVGHVGLFEFIEMFLLALLLITGAFARLDRLT